MSDNNPNWGCNPKSAGWPLTTKAEGRTVQGVNRIESNQQMMADIMHKVAPVGSTVSIDLTQNYGNITKNGIWVEVRHECGKFYARTMHRGTNLPNNTPNELKMSLAKFIMEVFNEKTTKLG